MTTSDGENGNAIDNTIVAEERFLQAEAIARDLVNKLSLLDQRAESYRGASFDLSQANEHLAELSTTLGNAVLLVQEYIEGIKGIDHNSILERIDETGSRVREQLGTYLEGLSKFQQELSNTTRLADSSLNEYKNYLDQLRDQVRELERQISYSAEELPRLVHSSIERSGQIISGAQSQMEKIIESLSATNSDTMQKVARSIHEPIENLGASLAKVEAECQQISGLQNQTKQSIESLSMTNADSMQQVARSIQEPIESLGANLAKVKAESQQISGLQNQIKQSIESLSTTHADIMQQVARSAQRLDTIQKACWICCSFSLGAFAVVLWMVLFR